MIGIILTITTEDQKEILKMLSYLNSEDGMGLKWISNFHSKESPTRWTMIKKSLASKYLKQLTVPH